MIVVLVAFVIYCIGDKLVFSVFARALLAGVEGEFDMMASDERTNNRTCEAEVVRSLEQVRLACVLSVRRAVLSGKKTRSID